MKTKTVYVSEDGTEFDDEKACRLHETSYTILDHVKDNCGFAFNEDANFSIIEDHHVADYVTEYIDEIIKLVKG